MSACTTHMPTDSAFFQVNGAYSTIHSLTLYRCADTTEYVYNLLAANNSLQSVVHIHEKLKLCSKYEKIQLMGIFSHFTSNTEHDGSMVAVLVRHFYDVCKYIEGIPVL